ncbi:MAG TPA: EAL domain-containing protein [Hyphomicrobiales bacterium]|nr:EAL domain-containing protein [Hyphomicrobiales bacterium]
MQSVDPWLFALAILLSAGAAVGGFVVLGHAQGHEAATARSWVFLAAVTTGTGVWGAEAVALLAYAPAPYAAVGYAAPGLMVSLIAAISSSWAALTLFRRAATPLGRAGAGAALGAGMAVVEIVGLVGLHAQGSFVWHAVPLGGAAIAAVGLAALAFAAAGHAASGRERAQGALGVTVALAVLAALGLSAIGFVPDARIAIPGRALNGQLVGVAVAAVTILMFGTVLITWVLDLQTRRENEQKLHYLARHDLLTGLLNRTSFQEGVVAAIARAAAEGQGGALLCLDMDGFKDVNDIFGHGAGDRVLAEVARRLRELGPPPALAARLGGDEFTLFVTDPAPGEAAAALARRIIERISQPIEVEGNRLSLGISIGVALYPADAQEFAVLMTQADIALSRAKAAGRGVCRFFEQQMDDAVRARRSLGFDLRQALGTAQLQVHYQPQFDMGSEQVIGFEALLRWNHPVRGAVSPSVFIPIAEESGTILLLGEWVLREACREAASWRRPLGIAVNLSAAQFRQNGLFETIVGVLEETGLAPERLELEITESILVENGERTLALLTRLKELGVRIAMDDFGTGYSSLSTLQSFPFDKIKIDQGFVSMVGRSTKSTAIVRAILRLGESLNTPVMAEGVETEEQRAFLRDQQCPSVQGFFYGEPAPITAYRELVHGDDAKSAAA